MANKFWKKETKVDACFIDCVFKYFLLIYYENDISRYFQCTHTTNCRCDEYLLKMREKMFVIEYGAGASTQIRPN